MTTWLRTRRGALAGAALVIGFVAVWVIVRPVFWGSGGPPPPAQFDEARPQAAITEMTRAAGFTHVHQKPQLDAKLEPIMPWVASVGAAAAAADFDNDGWIDLYVTSSRKGTPNRLYRNRGDGTFVDVGPGAGVAAVNDEGGVSTDCVWGDYDNDGHPDLFVVRWGRDILFRNQGDGTFNDVTARGFRDERGQPGSPWANGCSATWFDHDGDGLLDLYVGNYFAPFDLWHLEHTRIMHDDFEQARNAGRNSLFRNEGNGKFRDVAAAYGLDDPGWTLSVGHGDINNDGWPDLYCANDFGSDQLFLNTGGEGFENITVTALGEDTKKGMNVDFGDFDGNGWLDMYVTNITTSEYLREGNMLWHNDAATPEGIPMFMDVSVETQTYDGGWGWGAKFLDFDNDMDLDIVAVNGFITAGEESYWYDLASWTVMEEDVADARNWPPIGNRSFSGNEATRLWRNDGQMRFVEIAEHAGLTSRGDGRGVVAFDYDNDGDLDLYLANQGQPPAFFRNDAGNGGHWLALDLTGRPQAGSNRDAIGARVTVVTAAGEQIRELDGGNSYCGQSDRRLFFGLGAETLVGQLEIRWPSKRVQVLSDVPVDRLLTLEEPADLPARASLVPATRQASRRADRRAAPGPQTAPSPETREALLADLEDRVRDRMDDLVIASRYRAACVDMGEHQRAIDFFEDLAAEYPAVRNLRLQLSAAYIDKIPACGGMAAIVSKGTLARKSLDQVEMLVKDDPSWWPAVYASAMNHLHWPAALKHTDEAIRDFRACLRIQAEAGAASGHTYFVRTFVGLGDALAKNGEIEEAREIWGEGLRRFPGDRDLADRVALKTEEATRTFVDRARNLERQIDTDFSFLESP